MSFPSPLRAPTYCNELMKSHYFSGRRSERATPFIRPGNVMAAGHYTRDLGLHTLSSHHMPIIIHCIIIIPQKFMALDDYGCELWDFSLRQKYQTFFTRHLAWPQLSPASSLSVVDKTLQLPYFSSTLKKYSANEPSLPLLCFFFLQSHLEDVMSHVSFLHAGFAVVFTRTCMKAAE